MQCAISENLSAKIGVVERDLVFASFTAAHPSTHRPAEAPASLHAASQRLGEVIRERETHKAHCPVCRKN